MPKLLTLPREAIDCVLIASVSGGKDSTALILALREADIPVRYAFADTQWETHTTYEYLEYLKERLGIAIERVGYPGGMPAKIRENGRFPGRRQRWCTHELKIEPLRALHDAIEEESGQATVAVLGVRGRDLEWRRAGQPEFEDCTRWNGFVWRPLMTWGLEDVLAIHKRHNVQVNPMYQRGFNRVGCAPCIFSPKEEIRLLAEHYPERIDDVRRLEAEATKLRKQRNLETPSRYKHANATFFQTRRRGFEGIDAVVAWSRTTHGGRQLALVPPVPTGGCPRWGLCEPAEETGS